MVDALWHGGMKSVVPEELGRGSRIFKPPQHPGVSPALSPLDGLEATKLYEREIQSRIARKLVFTTWDIADVVNRRLIASGKVQVWRPVVNEPLRRLVAVHVEAAGWQCRRVELNDWRSVSLYYPTDRLLRSWLRRHLPGIFRTEPRRRRTRGKPGRRPKRIVLARFALVRRNRKRPMSWEDIAVEWQMVSGQDLSVEKVRGAAKRWKDRLKQRRAKRCKIGRQSKK